MIALVAIGLWVVSVLGVAVLFVRGKTAPSSDGRQAILLAPPERDLVLAEMRGMLTSVHGVVAGLNAQDLKQVSGAARQSGMAMAVDLDPALLAKLPLAFKKLGMQTHEEFDALADAADQGAGRDQLLGRVGEQLTRCVACHAAYRLEPAPSH